MITKNKYNVMTTKDQYRSRWMQLESNIQQLQASSSEAYKNLPAVPHESKEWKIAFNNYFYDILIPIKNEIRKLQSEAEYCRIRSLNKFYCNRHLFCDIQPYEVINVVSDTRLRLRSMNYKQTNGGVERLKESFVPGGYIGHFDNSVQEWICTEDPTGIIVEVRMRKNGFFYEVNDSTPYILSDKPKRYRDFNF